MSSTEDTALARELGAGPAARLAAISQPSGSWQLLCGGRWANGSHLAAVVDPDTGTEIAEVAIAGAADLELALLAAVRGQETAWPPSERAATLANAADRVEQRADRFAWCIAVEGIKTIREARREVARAVNTLRLSAAAATQLEGSELPDECRVGMTGWSSAVRSAPVGVVAAITPYNDPLNLVAHKVGPALAAGNAVIVKPDLRTPLTALLLGRMLIESGVPPGRLSVLPTGPDVSSTLVADPRVRFVSFTGGRTTGALVHRAAGVKHILMELGGVCPTLVFDDADLELAVPQLIAGAFGSAGQNCLHVQRVLVHRSCYDAARERLVAATAAVRVGRKSDEAVDMGPLIDAGAVRRVAGFVEDARRAGGSVLVGGRAEDPHFLPTLMENVPSSAALVREEVFGPVTTIEAFDTPQHAIRLANGGGGGIQAGVFTSRREVARQVTEELDFGGVVVGGTSDHRSDALPFGGTGGAGVGREGVGYAAVAMREVKTVLWKQRSTSGHWN